MSDTENFVEAVPEPVAGPSAAQVTGLSVDRVAIRLPSFYPENPAMWFALVEAQFEMQGIKADSTKFFSVLRELDLRTAREIRDIITNPPQAEKYEKLKSELIKRLSFSREQKMRQLLTTEELGDRKPSQFLRHLRALAVDGVGEEFLRSLWCNRLPLHIQAILASQATTPLDELATLADQIYEVVPSPSYQKQVASAESFEGMMQRLEQTITTRIQQELAQQIAQLNVSSEGRTSRRTFHGRNSRSNNRSRSRGRSQNRKPANLEKSRTLKTKILNLPQEDWIDKDVINGINKRNELFAQWKSNPENTTLLDAFKKERENAAKLIKTRKDSYYYNRFMKYIKKPKKIWDQVNYLAKNKIRSNSTPQLVSQSEILADPNMICNAFNDYFASIGAVLAENIPQHFHDTHINTIFLL
ncbi:uncharacterized protein LOC126381344 [Pectinophora gossypiella]|uniref:uncharacterized protein LOC126381344 n=1 Tax=Pectinophora gossypiella TaxID=13191 RepID=UPI00214E3FC9|nr:uncharacterized protein LOC126381344 [Pectinophora gossypiella]